MEIQGLPISFICVLRLFQQAFLFISQVLLSKLEKYGIRGNTLKLPESYLNDGKKWLICAWRVQTLFPLREQFLEVYHKALSWVRF